MTELPPDNLSASKLQLYLQDKVWPDFDAERTRLRELEAWARGRQPEPRNLKNNERKVLQKIARTPWMGLMVSTFAQQLIVDGYRKAGTNKNAEAWDTWSRNHMPSQQFALNRAAITFGYSYLRITEGSDPVTGSEMAVMKGTSPTKCYALYEDSYFDEWPRYALDKQPDGRYRWWTDDGYFILTMDGGKFKVVKEVPHDYARVPIVRFCNEIDLEGRCWGDVEPVIDLAARIDKTGFDRLLVQHFNSFKVRWATGLVQPDTESDVEQEKIRISNEEILISSAAEARFGTLEETTMDGFIQAYQADLENFLSVTQMPPNVAGKIVNVAADALAAGNRSTVQKLHEKQTVFGSAHNQALRLVNEIEGRSEEADDFDFAVHWQDPEVKSLAQFADAWGKMVDQLGIPKWGVWPLIPGIDQSTVKGWQEGYFEDNKLVRYLRDIHGQKGATQQGGPNSAQNQQQARNDNGEPQSAGE